MTTGQIIKKLREERNMTQEKLAELMGYSHKSSINKIEMGKSDLPQSKLVAFAKIFGVSPCVFVGAEPITPATQEQLAEWDEKYNVTMALRNEVLLIEAIQQKFGRCAVKLLQSFTLLNEQGRTKALDTLSDLSAIEKYQKKDGDQ